MANLDELKLNKILKELAVSAPPLKREIIEFIQHSKMLGSCEGLNPREVLNIANEYGRFAIEHRLRLKYLTGEAERLAPKAGKAGKDRLKDVRGLDTQMQLQLDDLYQEVKKLAGKANQGLNDPMRTPNPVESGVRLLDMAMTVLSLIDAYLKKTRT